MLLLAEPVFRSTTRIVPWGFPLAERKVRPTYSPMMPSIIDCTPDTSRITVIVDAQPEGVARPKRASAMVITGVMAGAVGILAADTAATLVPITVTATEVASQGGCGSHLYDPHLRLPSTGGKWVTWDAGPDRSGLP